MAQRYESEDAFHDAWQRVWDARFEALEAILGPARGGVYHGEPPIWCENGKADVLWFQPESDLNVYVTADFTGDFFRDQLPSTLGRYELMIATREPNDWAPTLLSRIAPHTLDAVVEPGRTVDLDNFITRRFSGSCIELAICCQPPPLPTEFSLAGETFGLLTLVGISRPEHAFLRRKGQWPFIERLERADVFPYTDPLRPCAVR